MAITQVKVINASGSQVGSATYGLSSIFDNVYVSSENTTTLTTIINGLNNNIKAANEEITELDMRISEARGDITTLTSKMTNLYGINGTDGRVGKLETDISALIEDTQALAGRVSIIEPRLFFTQGTTAPYQGIILADSTLGLKPQSLGSLVIGSYNEQINENSNDRPIFIVGNGTSDNARHNALEVYAGGKIIAGFRFTMKYDYDTFGDLDLITKKYMSTQIEEQLEDRVLQSDFDAFRTNISATLNAFTGQDTFEIWVLDGNSDSVNQIEDLILLNNREYRCVNWDDNPSIAINSFSQVNTSDALFSCSVIFQAKSANQLSIKNNTKYPLYFSGMDTDNNAFIPQPNAVYRLAFLFDGFFINCYVSRGLYENIVFNIGTRTYTTDSLTTWADWVAEHGDYVTIDDNNEEKFLIPAGTLTVQRLVKFESPAKRTLTTYEVKNVTSDAAIMHGQSYALTKISTQVIEGEETVSL